MLRLMELNAINMPYILKKHFAIEASERLAPKASEREIEIYRKSAKSTEKLSSFSNFVSLFFSVSPMSFVVIVKCIPLNKM